MNRILADEAVIFADAARPTHAVWAVCCWAPKDVSIAVEQSSGRDRLNIHDAIDLETGQTIMKDVPSESSQTSQPSRIPSAYIGAGSCFHSVSVKGVSLEAWPLETAGNHRPPLHVARLMSVFAKSSPTNNSGQARCRARA
jgi:hypothetical protein